MKKNQNNSNGASALSITFPIALLFAARAFLLAAALILVQPCLGAPFFLRRQAVL